MSFSFAPTTGGVSRLPVSALTVFILLLHVLVQAGPTHAQEALIKGPFILADAKTGAVVEHHDALRPWFPASTTKLMTAFVTFRAVQAGHVRLSSPVVMSKRAAAQPPSKIGFKAGTVLTVDNALKIIMVKSANDVAVALAETIGGSQEGFATMMNAEAKRLGMTRSHFTNPHGLPDKRQVTSARDMALLGRALLLEFPQYRSYLSVPAIKVGKRTMKNYNTLMERYPGTTGMKTGFICSSGFNLVASAKRGNRELIAVVFGAYNSTDRAERAAGLLNVGFRKRGGLFNRVNTSLNNVSSGRGYTTATDMRPIICSKNRPNVRATMFDEPAFRTTANGTISINKASAETHTNLGPKRSAGPAVVVKTGGADSALPGKGRNIQVAVVSLPKPRPNVPAPPATATDATRVVAGGVLPQGAINTQLPPVAAFAASAQSAAPAPTSYFINGQRVYVPRARPNR